MATIEKKSVEDIFASLSRRIAKLETIRSGIMQSGLAADRPTPSTMQAGITVSYFATDTNTLSIWNPVDLAWVETILS